MVIHLAYIQFLCVEWRYTHWCLIHVFELLFDWFILRLLSIPDCAICLWFDTRTAIPCIVLPLVKFVLLNLSNFLLYFMMIQANVRSTDFVESALGKNIVYYVSIIIYFILYFDNVTIGLVGLAPGAFGFCLWKVAAVDMLYEKESVFLQSSKDTRSREASLIIFLI